MGRSWGLQQPPHNRHRAAGGAAGPGAHWRQCVHHHHLPPQPKALLGGVENGASTSVVTQGARSCVKLRVVSGDVILGGRLQGDPAGGVDIVQLHSTPLVLWVESEVVQAGHQGRQGGQGGGHLLRVRGSLYQHRPRLQVRGQAPLPCPWRCLATAEGDEDVHGGVGPQGACLRQGQQRRVVGRRRPVLVSLAIEGEVVEVVGGSGGGPHGLPQREGGGAAGAGPQPCRHRPPRRAVLVAAQDEGSRRGGAGQGGHHETLGDVEACEVDGEVTDEVQGGIQLAVLLEHHIEHRRIMLASVHSDPDALLALLVHAGGALQPALHLRLGRRRPREHLCS
mmetsp:Transcript_17409/g.52175  ORF Transcript_17409/g.52175 Transcript_17409/m.52175 type:complete len:337 (+) Transcript_17409:3317-4327(+)